MPNETFQIFDKKAEKLIKLGRPKIAFGLSKANKEILESLKRGKKYADIVLVGPKEIKNVKGFDVVISNNPEARIASMLAYDEVNGIIRGTLDDLKTTGIYQKLTGEKGAVSLGLFKDPSGHKFFLNPIGNADGWQKEERFSDTKKIAEFIRKWGIEPKIAVFTGRRHETYTRKKNIKKGIEGILNKTYEEAEWIVKNLKEKGYEAENWTIDLNPAVEADCNILVPTNGMVGNQIFRVLLFCGGKVLFGLRLGLSRCYGDNSRTEKDFESHIKYLAITINKNRQ